MHTRAEGAGNSVARTVSHRVEPHQHESKTFAGTAVDPTSPKDSASFGLVTARLHCAGMYCQRFSGVTSIAPPSTAPRIGIARHSVTK